MSAAQHILAQNRIRTQPCLSEAGTFQLSHETVLVTSELQSPLYLRVPMQPNTFRHQDSNPAMPPGSGLLPAEPRNRPGNLGETVPFIPSGACAAAGLACCAWSCARVGLGRWAARKGLGVDALPTAGTGAANGFVELAAGRIVTCWGKKEVSARWFQRDGFISDWSSCKSLPWISIDRQETRGGNTIALQHQSYEMVVRPGIPCRQPSPPPQAHLMPTPRE